MTLILHCYKQNDLDFQPRRKVVSWCVRKKNKKQKLVEIFFCVCFFVCLLVCLPSNILWPPSPVHVKFCVAILTNLGGAGKCTETDTVIVTASITLLTEMHCHRAVCACTDSAELTILVTALWVITNGCSITDTERRWAQSSMSGICHVTNFL